MEHLLDGDEPRLWHARKKAADTVRARVAEQLDAATRLSDPFPVEDRPMMLAALEALAAQ